ncbi:MAG: nucleotidyl transferase AbiEii/AbiGii toxin family protein [Planctomycetes bacterium]|nr:nucleotidyl transferase AbiEii/AbiGii toxin family protein [Planctomycetota bacterium]
MKLSRERLQAEAQATGFRPEVLERVIHLLNLLEGFQSHPFLKGRLALKGGTAVNLFLFELPRLSVDIDLNYLGEAGVAEMNAERPKVEQAVQAVCSREGLHVTRLPGDHAGGKWRLRYDSALSEGCNLELDLNFMFRVPLWPVEHRDSHAIGSYKATAIPVLDAHELAAGKLTALLARRASRDLFDAHLLLTRAALNARKLRLGFVLYGAMNRKDWRTVSPKDIQFDIREIGNQLLPLVRAGFLRDAANPMKWAARLLKECQRGLDAVLPFSEPEQEFLTRLLDHGETVPSLLTSDEEMIKRITAHPLLQWKALNVRQRRSK